MLMLLVLVMGVHPEGDVHLLMLMLLLLPDDLLLLLMLSSCAHHLEGDTQTPTDDTRTQHTRAIASSLSLCVSLYVCISRET